MGGLTELSFPLEDNTMFSQYFLMSKDLKDNYVMSV